jgi:hypothetical protein
MNQKHHNKHISHIFANSHQDDEDVSEVTKNTANDGSKEHSGIEEKVPERWDPDLTVSTWDHSILGKAYSEPRKQKRQRQQPQTRENKSSSRQHEKNCGSTALTYSVSWRMLNKHVLTSVNQHKELDFLSFRVCIRKSCHQSTVLVNLTLSIILRSISVMISWRAKEDHQLSMLYHPLLKVRHS